MAAIGLYIPHFKKFIVKPVLKSLTTKAGKSLYSEAAVNLLTGTAIVESRLRFLRQIVRYETDGTPVDGVALGIYQVEKNTLADIYDNFLKYNPELLQVVEAYRGNEPREDAIISNLKYATAIARIYYFRKKEPLPSSGDYKGMAKYHKEHYNTSKGATNVDESEEDFVLAINDGKLPYYYKKLKKETV